MFELSLYHTTLEHVANCPLLLTAHHRQVNIEIGFSRAAAVMVARVHHTLASQAQGTQQPLL
jgi:hypothetical protein